jgi:dTDP-glucose pyrophosphorylase
VDRDRFQRIFVAADATLREAFEAIDAGAIEIALVGDEERRLVGVVTDGDLRRALLRGTTIDDPIDPIVARKPVTAPVGTPIAELLALMDARAVTQVPLMDEAGCVADVAFLRELLREAPGATADDSKVVIMAGGEGRRLRPLTDDTPKPMLKVGDRPLLETVLGQVRESGFNKVLMAVGYRADVIKDHFGNGGEFGVDIEYVQEDEPLGSAGALQLVRDQLDEPFIVLNADLLTNVNLGALLAFHREEGNVVTIGVRQYVLQVPYGVVDIQDGAVAGLREKPTESYFVNAGLYAVSPAAVKLLPAELRQFHMTDLVDAALAAGERVGSVPVREYWLDIGQLADYDRAHEDHATYFVAK